VEQRPAVTKHQKAVAEAVMTALRPLLEEINRKLDMIAEKIETVLTGLAETDAALREAAARYEATPPGAENDS
jgi:hypothetical protein